MIDTTISLVSVNQRQDLERLLPSLKEAASQTPSEILLVDNRSIDGSAEYMHSSHPAIKITRNPEISGYGENHNLNLQRARGRYFVIMNSDVTVAADVFLVLRDYMDRHPDVGLITPRILNPDGTIQGLNKRYPTIWDLFIRRFIPGRFKKIFKRRIEYYEMRDVGYESECEVPFLSGAFMFCRTSLLKELGGFDPQYFMYFEDADLCRRIQKTHRTVYCPATEVTHYWQRSAHKRWKFSMIFIQSAWRYFGRWGYKWF